MLRKRVLVTGATGLVGSYIARLLVLGGEWEVVATRRENSPTELLGAATSQIDWIVGDLRDAWTCQEALADCTHVVHAAGLVSYRAGDTQLLDELNAQLTRQLVDFALDAELPLQHFVHVSSIAALNENKQHDLNFEVDQHTTRYAMSKRRAELQVWRAMEEGLPTTIVNPSVVLGAGFWDRSSCRLVDWVAAGQRFYPPGSTAYVDVRDLAGFVVHLLSQPARKQRYVVSGTNATYAEFFHLLADALEVPAPQTVVSPWQAELAWRAEAARALVTGAEPLLTSESARRSLRRLSFDNRRSVELGARYRPLEQTVADLVASYRATRKQGYGTWALD